MKLAIITLLALLSFATAWHESVKIADKEFLEKQKFIFEIIYRVEDPLMFEEWIKRGDNLTIDKSFYTKFDENMEKFWQNWQLGYLLPKGEFFGALVKTQHEQAWGLFNFFYYAKDWATFVRNVCWARLHANEGMFAYALTLAVIHRKDCSGLMFPAVYEILPQHFFNSKFIYEAEKFDADVWDKVKKLENAYKEQKTNKVSDDENVNTQHTSDWKQWEWWRLFGFEKDWQLITLLPMRENADEFNKDQTWLRMINSIKMWFHPVDYTRDIEIFNEHTKLSYLTEDVGWNAYWYYLNMDYAFFLDGKTFSLDKDRRGEYWLYRVQQILARYNMERLSNGMGDIEQFSWTHNVKLGYNPQLVAYNGIGFTVRKNYWQVLSFDNLDSLSYVRSFKERIYDIFDEGCYKTDDGQMVQACKPEAIELIGNSMQGNIDQVDNQRYNDWYLLSHMALSNIHSTDQGDILPNVFLNFETMMRDPLFYMFHNAITDVFYRFKSQLQPYTRGELLLPGVTLKGVNVDKLRTFFDFVDFDVTSLLNDKMNFEEGKFVWDKTLLARQARLNHDSFHTEYIIEADKPQQVVIRAFLGPKYDEVGRTIQLQHNRRRFFKIDEFTHSLVKGENVIKRLDREIFFTAEDRMTYTELYKLAMLAIDGKYELPLFYSELHCDFPGRLLLPQGTTGGMPMQMFFIVSAWDADWEQASNFDTMYACGIGSGTRHIDKKAFGYPFDRDIDEFSFYVPNMYFKDVKIFHKNLKE